MFQYLYNIIAVIAYSVIAILGTILTGKQPKVSPYHLDKGLVGISDKQFWYDNDVPYKWCSRDTIKIAHNNLVLDKNIEKFVHGSNFSRIPENEKGFAAESIKKIILENNRVVL